MRARESDADRQIPEPRLARQRQIHLVSGQGMSRVILAAALTNSPVQTRQPAADGLAGGAGPLHQRRIPSEQQIRDNRHYLHCYPTLSAYQRPHRAEMADPDGGHVHPPAARAHQLAQRTCSSRSKFETHLQTARLLEGVHDGVVQGTPRRSQQPHQLVTIRTR